MLVIYRTNTGFEGDIVTVQTGDAALTAALLGPDLAVLDIELATADAAALIQSQGSYVVTDGLLCERKGEAEKLAGKRAEAVVASEKLTMSAQDAAVVAEMVK